MRQGLLPTSKESGGVLVEFALVSLVFYIILAATLDFGRLFVSAQLVQDAARVGARELALTPLPADPNFSFDDALADPEIRARVYDPDFLVVDLDESPDVDLAFANAPIINRMLRPLMFMETTTINGVERNLFRYPGAIIRNVATNELSVAIPRIVGRGQGVETIEWVNVVEEIRRDPSDPSTGSFPVTSNPGGLVALRVHYPFQGSALSGFRPSQGGPFEPNVGGAIEMGEVVVIGPSPGDLAVDDDGRAGAYAGEYGLGRHFALTRELRPWRRLVVGQLILRRETFR